MSLTATNAQVYKGTAAVTYGSGSGMSNRELQGTASVTYGGAPTSNTALSLPGTSGNYMNLGSTNPANIDTSVSNVFVEAWFYAFSYPSNVAFIIYKGGNNINNEDFGLWVSGVYGVNWRLWNTAGAGFAGVTGSNNLNVNQWYHVAGSWDVGTKTLYTFLNGTLLGPGTLTGTPRYSASSRVQIGAANSAGFLGDYYPFNGYIQDVRIVQGGIVPKTSFTPARVPFRLSLPPYMTSGSTVLSLAEQYFTPSWLSLPGTNNNYMLLPPTHPVNYDPSTSNVFVEAWVYWNGANWTATNGGAIYEKENVGSTVQDFGLYVDGSVAKLTAYMYTQNGSILRPIYNTALNVKQWYHVAFGYNTVNQTAYVWVNGLVGTTATASNPARYAVTYTFIGNNPFNAPNTYAWNGYIQDLRVTRGGTIPTTNFTPAAAPFGLASPSYVSGGTTVLSLATQYYQTGMTAKTLFNRISSAASASAKGIYSLYAINGASPLVINVRNGTTAATSDFYGDIFGNLTTSAGQSISSWLGAATGYIKTWYDQSGLGNHAAQATTALQPSITLGTPNFINYAGGAYFTIANQVMPTGNGVFTTVTKLGTHGTASQTCIWGFGTTGSSGCVGLDLRTDYNPNRYEEFFYGAGDVTGPTYTPNATVSGVYNQSSHTLYLNGAQVGTSAVSSRNGIAGNQYVGAINFTSPDSRGLQVYNGTMRDLYVFSTALSTADRNIMENGYTGTKVQFTSRAILPAVLVNPGAQTFTTGGTVTVAQTALEPANGITWSLAPTGTGLSVTSSTDYSLTLSALTAVTQNLFTVSATNKAGLTTVTQFTGATPIFNRISTSASGSVVGVYSLRALRSLYSRVVNIAKYPTSVFAISGNQYTLTDNSAAPPDRSVAGQTTFNGSSQYTRINSISITPATGLTIYMNFKMNATTGLTIFKLFSDTVSAPIIEIDINTTPQFIFGEYSSGTWNYMSTYPFVIGTTYSLVIQLSGTTMYVYINGSLVATNTMRLALSNGAYNIWGIGSWNGGGYTSMTLYNFAISNGLISPSYYTVNSGQQDFYADTLGNLTTGEANSGQTLVSWLGGATGYVTTWYDQSVGSKHGAQTSTGLQPTIDAVNRQIIFNGSTYFNLPNNTVPSGNSNYTMLVAHGDLTTSAASCFIGSGTYGTGSYVNALEYNGPVNTYYNFWWANDNTGGVYAPGNKVTAKYDNTIGRTMYVNGASVGTQANINRTSTTIQNTIGTDLRNNQGVGANHGTVGGIYYVLLFNTALVDADRLIVEGITIP